MVRAIAVLQREHRRLGRVLRLLQMTADGLAESHDREGEDTILGCLLYVENFIIRFHHPKEDEYLFPALQQRCPEAESILDRLQGEHDRGDGRLEALQAAFAACRAARAGWQAFRDQVAAYARAERAHMGLEEREILPRARAHLEASDWQLIDAAFEGNDDPLFSPERRAEFERLYGNLTALTAGD